MYATDVRQTDVRRQTGSLLNAPWAGHKNVHIRIFFKVKNIIKRDKNKKNNFVNVE